MRPPSRPSASHRRAAAPIRRSGTQACPRAPSYAAGHRRSAAFGAASASRAVEIGRARTGGPSASDLTGERRSVFRGAVAAPENGSGAVAPHWVGISCAGPSGAALRLQSTRYPRPPSIGASLLRPVSRPSSFHPPPPSARIRAAVHPPSPLWASSAVDCRRPPLFIRLPSALPPATPAPPFWSSHPPPSSSSFPATCHWHRAFTPSSGLPPRLPLPLAAPQLGLGCTMSGEGHDPFRPYSQPDPPFASGYYPMQPSFSTPPVATSGSQALAHSYSWYDHKAAFLAASPSAAAAHGGMAGAAHGYSGYGFPSGYHQCPPIADPARHLTSSATGFQAGPYASLPPIPRPPMPSSYGAYGEGSSQAALVDMPPVPPAWHAAAMGDEPTSSAVPGGRMTQSQSCRQATSPFHEVCSNDTSMPSDGSDDDLSLASSIGDNAGIVANAAAVQHGEGNGDSMGSEGEGKNSEEDLIWSSDGNSSDDTYEELYKGLEDLFGKENPVVKCMKLAMESSKTTTKLLKKAILLAMYEDSVQTN